LAIQITHVRFSGTGRTEAEIVRYRWKNIATGTTGDNDKPTMVVWVGKAGNSAYVGTGADRVDVGVVRPTHGQPYLRTHADGDWTNNLVNLPIF
jgi:hypothetical protein